MKNLRILYKIGSILLSAALLTSLSGCNMVSLFSSPIQKRGVTGFFSDNFLRLKINQALAKNDAWKDVEIMVHRGRVWVLGVVIQAHLKEEVLKQVQRIEGAKEIIDGLQIGTETFGEYTRDTWLGERLRALLFFDTRIYSQNYHICAVNKVIYILGSAQNQQELAYVIQHAESLPARRILTQVTLESPEVH